MVNLLIDSNNDDGELDDLNTAIDGDEDRRDVAKLTITGADLNDTLTLTADLPDLIHVFDETETLVTLQVTLTPGQLSGGTLTYWVEGVSAGTVMLHIANSAGTFEDRVKLIVGEEIGIKLTFDDGPYVANDFTKQVLTTLANNSVQDGIKATFFVQTHAVPGGGSPGGPELIAETGAVHQHHVEVHTGAKDGHISHVERVKGKAEDADGDGIADGENALESDLIRAKALIYDQTGRM